MTTDMILGIVYLLLGFFVLFLSVAHLKLIKREKTRHNWKYSADGMYGDLYECAKCKETSIVDSNRELAAFGCLEKEK